MGAEPEAVPAASSSSPFPSSLPLTLRPPSRLRHPPAPHTQDENALPGTTQQHLDGFGHGPAVAYPQHHLQPLRLGESLQAAAPKLLSLRLRFASAGPAERHCARAAPLPRPWHSGCREPPTPSSYRRASSSDCQTFCYLFIFPSITRSTQSLTALARKSPVACFPWLEHFLSAMSHSCFSRPPPPFTLCCSVAGRGRWAPRLPPTHTQIVDPHHFRDRFSALRILLPSRPVCAFL